MSDARARWDSRYHQEPALATLEPSPFLVAEASLLPDRGRALDVACGAGRNALFLAERGLRVVGVDISPVGLALARRAALARGLPVALAALDLERARLPEASFDAITCIHYLERSLFGELERALRPRGVLVYETFTRDQLAFPEAHPRRPEFLLAPQELLRAFPRLEVLRYAEREERACDGRRSVLAQLVAWRRG